MIGKMKNDFLDRYRYFIISPEYEAQLTNYLKATNIDVGLLLNFGQEPQHKRKVFANDRKKS